MFEPLFVDHIFEALRDIEDALKSLDKGIQKHNGSKDNKSRLNESWSEIESARVRIEDCLQQYKEKHNV